MEPSTGQSGQGDKGRSQFKLPSLPLWLWLFLILLTVGWNIWSFTPHEAQPANLPYSTFLEQVRGGNVAQVEMVGEEVRGEFKEAIPWSPEDEPEPAQHDTFVTNLPPVDDQRLLPLLEEQGVTLSARPLRTPWFLSLLLNGLPLLLLVGLLYISSRQMQKAQGGIFSFGRSQARLYDQAQPGVSFADVAGEDQAKLELAEIVDFLRSPSKYHRLGGRIPRGVLLVGPPGTGKTLLARAVAGEAGVPFFSLSASEFVEMFVGVGASRVRDLFQKVKRARPASSSWTSWTRWVASGVPAWEAVMMSGNRPSISSWWRWMDLPLISR